MTYEDLIKTLNELKPGVDYETAEGLLENKIITSFDVMFLAARLAEVYDVELDAADIVPEHFYSAKTLYALIESKEEA